MTISLTEPPPHSYKVSGVLDFNPYEHPTIGTNLREPVPADPELIPKFTPVNQATRAERAAQSAALIKEAGLSARQIGVPLTLQDFPDHPSMNHSGRREDPMHASIPLFGLRDPRWRAKQGLDNVAIPGTVAYDGVVVPPGGTGLRLYNDRTRGLKVPLIRQGTTLQGIGVASSSTSTSTSASNSNPKPPALCRTSTMAAIQSTRSTTSETTTTTLKRGRRTAEVLEVSTADDDMITDSNSNQEKEEADQEQEEAEPPARKRRKRSAASSDATSKRSSTRVTRAKAAVPQPRPAPRGRATKGKKGNKLS